MYWKIRNYFDKKKALKKKRLFIDGLNKRSNCIDSSVLLENAKIEDDTTIYKGTNISSSTVGYGTVIGENCVFPNSIIGRFCAIASDVHVVYARHPLDMVSIYGGFYNTKAFLNFGKGTREFDDFLKTSRDRQDTDEPEFSVDELKALLGDRQVSARTEPSVDALQMTTKDREDQKGPELSVDELKALLGVRRASDHTDFSLDDLQTTTRDIQESEGPELSVDELKALIGNRQASDQTEYSIDDLDTK